MRGRRGGFSAVACNEGVVNVDDIDRASRSRLTAAHHEARELALGAGARTHGRLGYPPAHDEVSPHVLEPWARRGCSGACSYLTLRRDDAAAPGLAPAASSTRAQRRLRREKCSLGRVPSRLTRGRALNGFQLFRLHAG